MNNYISYNHKKLKHPDNKEFVTSRVNIINKKKVLCISIGTVVCELLGLVRGDRVEILLNKKERNLLLIRKAYEGYKLKWGGANSNFVTFDFRYETPDNFRLSQTVILDYNLNDFGFLLINLDRIKWNN